MNTLPNVTMMMEKYKSREGDIEISNQSGKGLKTWEYKIIFPFILLANNFCLLKD